MITQTLQLNLVPKGVWPRLYVSQYDAGSRTLTFEIYNGDQRFTLTSGTTAKIQGTKPDRHGFSYDADVDTSNNVITADITQQMTAAHGEAYCELVLFKSGQRIGTLNFVMMIQQAGLNDETDTSDSDLPDIIAEATEQMLTAEAYAKGTRNGTAVTSGQTGYHDNSKYYKEQAATQASNANTSATNANTNALKAEGYAVGKQNGTTQTSGTYYHNNAQYYKEQAADSATTASTKAGEASSSANTASQKASAASTSAQTASDKALVAEGYAKGTQNGTPVGSTSPYYHNNAEYFKNLANPTVAANVSFNNSGTDMSSTNVQDGIVENRTSIQNLSNQVNYNTENCVKNALPFPYDYSNKTTRTIVANVNIDGSISISGTNSSTSVADVFHFSGYLSDGTWIQKYAGKEIVVKCEGLPANSIGYAPFILYDSSGTQLSRTDLDSSTSMLRTTIPSNVHHVIFSFYVRGSKTISTTLKPMFCESFLYDIESSWSSPAHSNVQLTQETTGLIDNQSVNGAVNMLPNTATTQVINGVTFTVNDDDTVTVSGTATGDTRFHIATNFNRVGTYALSGTVNQTAGDRAVIVARKNSTSTEIWSTDPNNPATLTVSNGESWAISVFVGSGRTVNNETVKPMLTVPSYTGDYVPYAKSNKELTEDVAAIVPHIMKVVQVSGVNIFDILSNLDSYPAKTEYYCYSTQITNGSSTLGNLLNTGDYGIVSIKKYDEWMITISIISANSMGKTHMAIGNKNNTSIKFVNNDPGASTNKVTTTTINKAT